MNQLILKNDRHDAGTWVVASAIMAIGALAGFIALIVANVRDPAALWMGPKVKSPQDLYLIGEGFVLALATGFGLGMVFKAKRYYDVSPQLVIDCKGIRDLRPHGETIQWSNVSSVKCDVVSNTGYITSAILCVVTKGGRNVWIRITGLDKEPNFILGTINEMMREATGRGHEDPRAM